MSEQEVKRYADVDGNPCSLLKLIKTEPEWAENVIKSYEAKLAVCVGALEYVMEDEPNLIPRASSSCRKVVRQALKQMEGDEQLPVKPTLNSKQS